MKYGKGILKGSRLIEKMKMKEEKTDPPEFNVLGVAVSGINLESTKTLILQALAAGRKGYICVTGVHGVSEARKDPAFRRILNSAFLNTPDGMPLVWLGKHHCGPEVNRVYGPDLMIEICSATENTSYGHYFFGGAPGVAETLGKELKKRFSGIEIAGFYTPPFRPLNTAEEEELINRVREARPAIVWVGLSTPKQERFMAAYLDKLDTTLMLGVGAAFDFHTGRVRQAPKWIQRSGFEWFYRLCQEPKRLWKRYLTNNPRFLLKIALQTTGLKKFPIEPK